jgi:hypothetical protein
VSLLPAQETSNDAWHLILRDAPDRTTLGSGARMSLDASVASTGAFPWRA